MCVALFLAGCQRESAANTAPEQIFAARGVVKELKLDGKTVVIQHEAISNYMAAMTMPFEARDTNDLRGLKPGDTIAFRLHVTPKEGWIDGVTVLQKASGAPPAATAEPTVRVVTVLDEGDPLPDCHLTNELGQAVNLGQYKGQVIAFTFFFTSCPFPNFCPRLSGNFAEAAAQLAALPDKAPGRWHLFSITFDPRTDTPARLLDYAQAEHYNPAQWSFLTGDIGQIRALGDGLGEAFWTENGAINHNMRTVVVDAGGRIRKIYEGNNWTSADLVMAMIKAAKMKEAK